MAEGRAIFRSLRKFSNAGVWKSFQDSKSRNPFACKTIIYGFNGSGKTTLSRAFASVQVDNLVDELPEKCDFEFDLSDGTKIASGNLNSFFGNDLLVFNQDFISKNFKWDTSVASSIAYLSEKKIDVKEAYDKALIEVQELQGKYSQAEKDQLTAEKNLKAFRTDTAKDVRERGRSKQYTQAFNAKKIDPAYAEQPLDESFVKSDNEIDQCVKTLQQDEPLPQILPLGVLSFDPIEWTEKTIILLKDTPSTIMVSGLDKHPQMAVWVEQGLTYHIQQELDECLLCGNDFSNQRKKALEASFDDTWKGFIKRLQDTRENSTKYLKELNTLFKIHFGVNDLQASQRADFPELEKQYAEHIKKFGLFLRHIDNLLSEKLGNPSEAKEIEAEFIDFDAESWYGEYNQLKSKLTDILTSHNKVFDDFSKLQETAFLTLRNHVLAEKLKDYETHKNTLEEVNNEFDTISQALKKAREQKATLSNELRDHGIGAEKLNGLLRTYLGHSEITLTAVDGGYKIIREGGWVANHLSEGEKTAIAFCYFLTLFEADGRKKDQLIVVIDDPISSLDIGAKTHAFSLMRSMTKKCAQTIILTHNLSFMNMVKREFMSKRYKGRASFLTIECRVGDDDRTRTSTLLEMSPLLKNYDSEYHYLFSLVYSASQSESSDFHHLLPNITRKVLEMFVAYSAPDKENFADALLGQNISLADQDLKALERLVQIESHGKMEGMEAFPALTVGEAIRAAKSALAFIEERDQRHYKAMVRKCKNDATEALPA